MQQLYLDCLTVKVFWYSKLVQKHLKELVSGWISCTQPWFSYVAHKLSKFLRMNQNQVWLQMLLVPIEDLEIRRKAPHLKTPGFCSTHFVVRKVSWQESICSRTHPIRKSIYSRGRRKSPTPHPNSDCFHMTSRNKAFAFSQGFMMKVYLKLWGIIFRSLSAPCCDREAYS